MPGLTISCLILKRMKKTTFEDPILQHSRLFFQLFDRGGRWLSRARCEGGVGVWIERNMFSMARGQKIRKTNLDSESGWVSPRE